MYSLLTPIRVSSFRILLSPTRVLDLFGRGLEDWLLAEWISTPSLYQAIFFLGTLLADSELLQYVLNPRFGLTTPMQSGLFYLAPGAGYLLGTFVGGRYADHVVKKYIKKSEGARIPEDRLRSALPFMGVVIPGCVLIYGWSVEKNVGGIPLAVVVLFLQGVAQLFCFPSLNTYCLDVMPSQGSDVISGNYIVRYLFGCLGTGVVLPAVNSIGVGWFSTISASFLVCSAGGICATITWGAKWRDQADRKRRAKKFARAAREKGEAREPRHAEGHVRRSSSLAGRDHERATEHVDPEKEREPASVDVGALATRDDNPARTS